MLEGVYRVQLRLGLGEASRSTAGLRLSAGAGANSCIGEGPPSAWLARAHVVHVNLRITCRLMRRARGHCRRRSGGNVHERRLTSIVWHLRAALPKTRLVLLAVFPRGASARRGDAPVPWPNNYTAVCDRNPQSSAQG